MCRVILARRITLLNLILYTNVVPECVRYQCITVLSINQDPELVFFRRVLFFAHKSTPLVFTFRRHLRSLHIFLDFFLLEFDAGAYVLLDRLQFDFRREG